VTEGQVHAAATATMFVLAAATALALTRLVAPYGRHERPGFGPTIPARVGWIVMESPAVLAFAAIFATGRHAAQTVPSIMLALWLFHYLQRTFVFPLRMRSAGKRMPVLVVAAAIVFNLLNAWVNARWISHLHAYPDAWLTDPRFLAGTCLFGWGWLIHTRADAALFALRGPGETGYKVPRAGLHRLVAAPNYLGEILEWCGWALLTWSTAGLSFAVYTIANLAPRASAHRRWYRERFADYPTERRALIPFVW
jgi:protein-S-isoprenylcysteine O-methyltransferase Ste14